MARAPATIETEIMPEASRLESFPHPRETKRLFGHGVAERLFASALASAGVHHAWLVTGAAGIGKATFAYRVARAALARPGEKDMFADGLDIAEDCATARQILAQAHPGLLVIQRPYDSKGKRFASAIPVDEVRRVRSFLALSAEAQGWRAVIVDSADELNINAANALLKSLEEPPPRTIFLLVSSEPGRLIPTIRSRCRLLPLEALDREDLKAAVSAALSAAGKPPIAESDFEALLPLSAGSPRRMLSLLEGGGIALQDRIERLLSALPALDIRAAHGLSDELQPAAQEQKFELFYDLLFAYLARLVRAQASGAGSEKDIATAARLIGSSRLATFAEVWETLVREKAEALTLNLDRKALILDSLARLEAAART